MLNERDNNTKLKEMEEKTLKKQKKNPINEENREQPKKRKKTTTMGNGAFWRTETKPHAYEQQTQWKIASLRTRGGPVRNPTRTKARQKRPRQKHDHQATALR